MRTPKVCDLVDDCGDNSDEESCLNHFKCTSSGEIVPLSAYRDGVLDCRDFSDECGNKADQGIISEHYLTYFAWLIGGLAVLFNFIAIVSNLKKLPGANTAVKATNIVLILMISIGDLLMGVYLVSIAGKVKTRTANKSLLLIAGVIIVLE